MNSICFESVHEAAIFLCNELQKELTEQIDKYGNSILIVPGGTSIKKFYSYMIKIDIPWDKVTIALSDERCVPIDDPMRNEKQLREQFLNRILLANYRTISDELIDAIRLLQPITILSMGVDGHIASLFPEESSLWKNVGVSVFETVNRSPKRISLSEKALLLSKKIYVLVLGREKNDLFENMYDMPNPLGLIYKNSNFIRC